MNETKTLFDPELKYFKKMNWGERTIDERVAVLEKSLSNLWNIAVTESSLNQVLSIVRTAIELLEQCKKEEALAILKNECKDIQRMKMSTRLSLFVTSLTDKEASDYSLEKRMGYFDNPHSK